MTQINSFFAFSEENLTPHSPQMVKSQLLAKRKLLTKRERETHGVDLAVMKGFDVDDLELQDREKELDLILQGHKDL